MHLLKFNLVVFKFHTCSMSETRFPRIFLSYLCICMMMWYCLGHAHDIYFWHSNRFRFQVPMCHLMLAWYATHWRILYQRLSFIVKSAKQRSRCLIIFMRKLGGGRSVFQQLTLAVVFSFTPILLMMHAILKKIWYRAISPISHYSNYLILSVYHSVSSLKRAFNHKICFMQ